MGYFRQIFAYSPHLPVSTVKILHASNKAEMSGFPPSSVLSSAPAESAQKKNVLSCSGVAADDSVNHMQSPGLKSLEIPDKHVRFLR